MVDESRQHRDQVCWFTSLVGRYASLGPLVARVKRVTDNYAVIKLQQSRTARWVLVWGYTPYRLPDVSNGPGWSWLSYVRRTTQPAGNRSLRSANSQPRASPAPPSSSPGRALPTSYLSPTRSPSVPPRHALPTSYARPSWPCSRTWTLCP